MVGFEAANFWKFCGQLTINSKEFGAVRLAKPYGPQRWIIREMARGWGDGVHDFSVLKCRQLGASTVMLAMDLWWLFSHGGMDGTLVTQDEGTFVNFRTQLSEFYERLPRRFKPYSPAHNRSEFVFRLKDGRMSRLQYQIAGTRMGQAVKLGRAKGNAFCHGTEVAYWADQGAFLSLKNSLAEKNPHRLFVWESTANGFNGFEEQWKTASRAVTQRAIFVSWWAHELYTVPRESEAFRVYWGVDGRMTGEERELADMVSKLYGDCMESVWGRRELSPEQLAWYRWYSEEKCGDAEMAKQEMPWVADQAFVTTGAQYFRGSELTKANRRISGEEGPRYMRIEVGNYLQDTQFVVCPAKIANLLVFAPRVEGAQYVLGADPAYGSSDWADAFVISVWRAWWDRIEQVAEFHTVNYQPFMFAWAMVFLAGMYAPCAWNLEVNGPGAAVLGEIDNLRRGRWQGEIEGRKIMENFMGGMSEFYYSRYDGMNRNPAARGTQSTHKEKNRYMDLFKDYFTRGYAVPHSRPLLEECRWITREPGQAPSGSARHKDDRVIAAALAVLMWHDRMRNKLQARNLSWSLEQRAPEGKVKGSMTTYDRMVLRQRALLGLPVPGQEVRRR